MSDFITFLVALGLVAYFGPKAVDALWYRYLDWYLVNHKDGKRINK